MSEENPEQLLVFLKDETNRIRRQTSRAYIAGGLFALVVASYMGFILWMVKGFLEPQNLAILVGSQISESLPQLIEESEAALADQAPRLSNDLAMAFIRVVPRLADAGKEQIDIAYKEQIPFISSEFSKVVEEYIDANSVELEQFAKEHSDEVFASYFTEMMMTELGVQLNERMKSELDGRDLDYFKDNLMVSLLSIDTTLDEMLAENPQEMNRHKRLQRRILARLVSTVHEVAEEEDK